MYLLYVIHMSSRLEQRHIIRFLFSIGEIAIRVLVVWLGAKIAARYFQER